MKTCAALFALFVLTDVFLSTSNGYYINNPDGGMMQSDGDFIMPGQGDHEVMQVSVY